MPSHRRYKISKTVHRYIITYDFQPFLYKNPKTTSFKDRESFKLYSDNGRKK
jgi:hypothetical protein